MSAHRAELPPMMPSNEDFCDDGPGARRALLRSLLHATRLDDAVPRVLDLVEAHPLASAGCFAGDLLRGLMSVPGSFWRADPALYERYRASVRAGALARRRMSYQERMKFWSALDRSTLARDARPTPTADPESGEADGDPAIAIDEDIQ